MYRTSVVLLATGFAAASAFALPASPASADSAWFVDPVTPAARAKEIPVPAHPTAYNGKRKHTVATYRTRSGSLALPARSAVGHRLEAGQALVLNKRGYFRFDSTSLTRGAKKQVRALAGALTDVRGVRCEGYADFGGPEGNERHLARDRARAACALLRKVAPQVSTDVASYGSSRPVVVGGSRSARAANRRVVIVVTSAVTAPPTGPQPPTIPQVPANHPPVANADSATVDLCSPGAMGNVLTNDSDPDGDTLTVTNPGTQMQGTDTLLLGADGSWAFTSISSSPGFTEVYDYSISDGRGGTATSTLTIKALGCPF